MRVTMLTIKNKYITYNKYATKIQIYVNIKNWNNKSI